MIVKIACDRKRLNHAEPGTFHLLVGVTAPDVAEKDRPAMDIVLVIDISGSMNQSATDIPGGPTKLALTKYAIQKFVEQLQETDRVGIVVFDSTTEVLVPLAELRPTHRDLVAARVNAVESRFGTNLTSGAICGLTQIGGLPAEEGRTKRAIIFTDGQTNEGIVEPTQIVTAIQTFLPAHTSITTIGFGAAGGYNQELLQAIAGATGGNAYHAEGEDGILSNFALELGSLKSAAATDVKIAITPVNQMSVKSVATGFPVQMQDGVLAVNIGTLYSGETKYVVVGLAPPPSASLMPMILFAADVRVTGLEATGSFEKEAPVHIELVAPHEADTEKNIFIEEQRLLLAAASVVKNAYELAAHHRYQDAVKLIDVLLGYCAEIETPEIKKLVEVLTKLSADLGDAKQFMQKKGTIQTTSFAMGTQRATGSEYADELYTSPKQRQTLGFMKATPPVEEEMEEKPAPPLGHGHTVTIFEK